MTDAAAAFFDLIHPATGWRCLFTLPDRKHHWFQDSAALAAAAARLDAEGKAVFHSCATFTEKQRKQEHVANLKALWFDLDAGPDKPYHDAAAAYRALEAWRQSVGLVPALVVASGGGLHAYWPLRDPCGVAQWSSAAHTLRTLAQQHGLHIDPGSTIDSARILRPPGTHNRKVFDEAGKKLADIGGPPRLVRCGPLVGPYDEETLRPLFCSPTPTASPFGPVPDYLKSIPPTQSTLAIGARDDRPSDPYLVVEQCAQVRRLRDAQGNLPEPEWYAVLGVLAHCQGESRVAAHEWSCGDPRYTPDDTDRKFDQAARASGPTTCERFRVLNPSGCDGCPAAGRVTTPVQLGRDQPAAVTAAAPPGLSLPALPEPFTWYGTRLGMTRKPTEADPSTYQIISDYPITIVGLQEGERSGGISAIFRSWEPIAYEWREFVISLKDILTDRGNGHLAHHGVAIRKSRWDAMRNYIVTMTNHFRGTKAYGTRYEQFGWKDESSGFVVGPELLRAGAVPERVFGSAEVTRRAPFLEAHGTLAGWSKAAHAAVAQPGMEAHAFVAICAFAAPLYQFVHQSGGTVVHAATMVSGAGKTFALDMAASVWGDIVGLRLKAFDTAVAKFIAIGTLGHLPVIYDELRVRGPDGPDVIKEFILHYTLGEDKARGAAEGGLRSDNLPWSNLLLSAANISLIDTCLVDGNETAQARRVFEFTPVLPQGTRTTDGDDLERALRENRGTAGRAFIAAVLANVEWVKKALRDAMRAWEKQLGAGPDQRHILRLLAVVTVAAALLTQSGILRVDLAALKRWMEATARENAARIAPMALPDLSTIIGRMINDLVPTTLVMPGPAPKNVTNARYEALREPRGELAARYEIETREFLVDSAAVRKWMQQHNYPVTQIGRRLQAEGIVTDLNTRRTLGAGWRRATGQVWCWRIDGKHAAVSEMLDETQADGAVDPAHAAAASGVVVPFREKA